jgi:hypothetical protein
MIAIIQSVAIGLVVSNERLLRLPAGGGSTEQWGSASMTDLSDFGGGRRSPDPEDQVKIDLSNWFESHGAEVFWEKEPSYGRDVFSTTTTRRPDLLVRGRKQDYAVEVKPGDAGGGIHDGVIQTWDYWRRVADESVQEYYEADGDRLEPDAFLLATEYAPDGKLFYRWGHRETVRDRPAAERLDYFDPPIHFLPDWEFSMTESNTRLLWRLADRDTDNVGTVTDPPGIGTVLSDRLDGQQPDSELPVDRSPFDRSQMPAPRALYKSYDDKTAGGALCHNWRWVR